MPYAFWRKHDTRLVGAGKTDAAPVAVLQALGESASVNADGSISWQFHQTFEDFRTTISSSIAIVQPDGQELNETDSIDLISRAVNKVIQRHKGGKGIRPKELIDQVERNAAEFFARGPMHRIFVSSISAAPEIVLPPKILGLHVRRCNRRDFPYSEILSDEVMQDQNLVYKHITSSFEHGHVKLRPSNTMRGVALFPIGPTRLQPTSTFTMICCIGPSALETKPCKWA